jgi:SAM-dependent methyltransferase
MKAVIRRIYNTQIDRMLKVSTFENTINTSENISLQSDQLIYLPADYLAIMYLLRPVRFGPTDVFVDIGSGLGRVLFIAARRPIRRAVGIEFDPPLALQAEQNARQLRGAKAPIEIRNQDATVADYSEGTIFWLYNPFGKATMQIVLERLRQSLIIAPRRITIIYTHPVLATLLDAQSWLKRVGERRFPGGNDNARAIYWEANAQQ